MKQLSLGLVIDDSLDSTGGVQQFVLDVGREFKRRGHKVRYLTSQTSQSHPESKDIYSLSRNIKAKMNGNRINTPLPASKRRIRAALEKEAFDVVHVMTPYSPALAGRIIRATDAAVVGTFHIAVDTFIAGLGARLLSLLQWRTLRRFDYWTAASQPADNFAHQYYRIVPDEITTNPITIKNFRKVKAQSTPKLRIVFLGRLVERKGAQHLLAAVNALDESTLSKIEVVIGGGGPLRSNMEQFVADHKLESVVRFTGFVPEADKPQFLADAALAVFPATGGECFGISVVEAMAVDSTATLGGDNQGYRSILQSGPNVLVDAHDTPAFSKRLAQLINDQSEREKIIEWQNTEVEQYDVRNVADKLEKVYAKAIEKRLNSN